MRILIRSFSLMIMGMIVSIMLIHCFDLTIRVDELDRVARQAMNQTQMVMLENIEDYYYKTNNARFNVTSSEDYMSMYYDNLNTLKTSNGNYMVDGYFDPLKGLAYVDINYSYTNFLGQEKTLNKKLINIIDVVKYEENS